jgi:hypothetical protein
MKNQMPLASRERRLDKARICASHPRYSLIPVSRLVNMRLLRHGWISALGWAALACWATFLALLSQLDRRQLDPHQHPALEILSVAAFLLTLAWLRWRVRIFRWKVRSRAWYEGREEARERWRKEHPRKKRG